MDPRRPRFRDRTEAARELARQLRSYAGRPDVLVLALPRGGVPVAYEVAASLDVALDVFLVRKLGVPGHEELAMGVIRKQANRNWEYRHIPIVDPRARLRNSSGRAADARGRHLTTRKSP